MGQWLTSKGSVTESNIPNRVITNTNQLYKDNDGSIYMVPRNTVTDNYTIPLGINKSKYDTRPSHLHDIGCYYHKVIKVNLPEYIIRQDYLYLDTNNNVVCKDIPIEYLVIEDISFNNVNNLFYRAMGSIISIPKYINIVYRLGVGLNLNWLLTGIDNIELNNIYKYKLYT